MAEITQHEHEEVRKEHPQLLVQAEGYLKSIEEVHDTLLRRSHHLESHRDRSTRRVYQLYEAADRLYQSIWEVLASALNARSAGVNATDTVTEVCASLVEVLRQLSGEATRMHDDTFAGRALA